MNHCVPNFDMDEDFNDLPPTASPSGSARHNSKKSAMAEEDIMELLWQNGQVVMQTQNQRSFPKSNFDAAGVRAEQPVIRPPGEGTAAAADHHVFLEEDEMASWLHYPLHEQAFDGRDLYSDLLYPPAASCAPGTAAIHARETRPAAGEKIRQPPIQMRAKCAEIQDAPPRIQNFGHFSRLSRGRIEPGPSSSSKAPIESTIVDSCETPQFSRANVRRRNGRVAGATALPSAGVREESVTCEQTVTSSPGGSEDSGSAEPSRNPELVSWKRKQRDVDEMEGHSEDMDLESLDTKKEGRSGCASTKRSRAAQVHNLSERRRRDRINEKMKALQELIPRCTKVFVSLKP
ncbi:unnamed protein product [Cuscuta campestris]|uniref:BHLH domain-containing protein n=1 Tax=Cuscuta campestris TaxID=132261 RepID=A0A484N484_9ASTE|nr:unnamed protein product [Cuscuta campestris]